jgi:hypothetical protein
MEEGNKGEYLDRQPGPGDLTGVGSGSIGDELSEEELEEASGGLLRSGSLNPIFQPTPPPIAPVFQPEPPPIKSVPSPPPI